MSVSDVMTDRLDGHLDNPYSPVSPRRRRESEELLPNGRAFVRDDSVPPFGPQDDPLVVISEAPQENGNGQRAKNVKNGKNGPTGSLVGVNGKSEPNATLKPPKLSRPAMLRHNSSPVFGSTLSPTRHHFRLANTVPREIKETLDAKYKANEFGQTIRINQYVLEHDIGSGSFGSVRMAIDETTRAKYAVKEYSKSRLQRILRTEAMQRRRRGEVEKGPNGRPLALPTQSSLDLVRREIAIMKKLDHPNIVGLVEVLDDQLSDKMYMIMEWCEKGVIMPSASLSSQPLPLSEEHCRLFFRDMILGTEYLHSQGVIHRDIKPENILLSEDDVVKIADFGVSELVDKDNDVIKKTAGSPAYMAPELAMLASGTLKTSDRNAADAVSGKAADIWSMGVTLFYMRYGKLPFQSDTVMGLYKCIINDPVDVSPLSSTDSDGVSDELRDMFSKMLEKSPRSRITMPELRAHPWVTCNGEDELLSVEENTADHITPVTEEDLLSAIEHIKGFIEPDEAAVRLRKLHGWRGSLRDGNSRSSSLSRESVTESAESAESESSREPSPQPPMPIGDPTQQLSEKASFSKLSLALDEIIFGTTVTVPRQNEDVRRPSDLADLGSFSLDRNVDYASSTLGAVKSAGGNSIGSTLAGPSEGSAIEVVGDSDNDDKPLERRPSRTKVRDLLGLEMTSLRSRSLDSDTRL